MLAFLLLCFAASRRHRHRRARSRTNGGASYPYFIASKRYEPADYPDHPEEGLPPTEAEKFEEKKVRRAKKQVIEGMVADEVAQYLADLGLTSDLAQQLKMAKMLSTTLDVFIAGAQAEIRRRRRLVEA